MWCVGNIIYCLILRLKKYVNQVKKIWRLEVNCALIVPSLIGRILLTLNYRIGKFRGKFHMLNQCKLCWRHQQAQISSWTHRRLCRKAKKKWMLLRKDYIIWLIRNAWSVASTIYFEWSLKNRFYYINFTNENNDAI